MAKPSNFSAVECTLAVALMLLIPAYVAEYIGVQSVRVHGGFDHNPNMPQYVDAVIAVAFTVALLTLRWVLIPRFEGLARLVLSPTKRTVQHRVCRFGRSLFNLLYFTIMTNAGNAILKDEAWFPTSLGGSGDVLVSFTVAHEAPSRAIRLYVLMQFAFQAQNLVAQLLEPYDHQTLEVVVHDLVAMLLIGSSYLGNFVAIGTIIGFVNDASDMFECFHFVVVDTDIKPLTVTGYLGLLTSWGYFRLAVYPFQCVYYTVSLAASGDLHLPTSFIVPINSVLVLLLVLQTYWFVLFAGKAPRLLGNAKTTTNTTDKMTVETIAPMASVEVSSSRSMLIRQSSKPLVRSLSRTMSGRFLPCVVGGLHARARV